MDKSEFIGSNFDDFLKEEGLYEECKSIAVKKVLAYQIQEEMKKQNMSQSELAKKMHTSRSSLSYLLDPENSVANLTTIIKASDALGKEISIHLS